MELNTLKFLPFTTEPVKHESISPLNLKAIDFLAVLLYFVAQYASWGSLSGLR